jgi:hypothetical protein
VRAAPIYRPACAGQPQLYSNRQQARGRQKRPGSTLKKMAIGAEAEEACSPRSSPRAVLAVADPASAHLGVQRNQASTGAGLPTGARVKQQLAG